MQTLYLQKLFNAGDTMEAKVLKVNDGEGQVITHIQDDLQQRKATSVLKRHLRTRKF